MRDKRWNDRTRGISFPVLEGRDDRWDIGKEFFPVRVMRHWHRLPTEMLNAPSLEIFKVRLDRTVNSLV